MMVRIDCFQSTVYSTE